MKEQILPELPIVGKLKLESRDGKSLFSITPTDETPSESLDPFFEFCLNEFEAYFAGKLKDFTITLDLEVSPFHQQVLRVMREIPYGETASYKNLAHALNSKAYQAIGSACGRNPLMIIYPCHRVLGSNGMGGFAHGLTMKKALLELESSFNATSFM